jgi:hypothetical protein
MIEIDEAAALDMRSSLVGWVVPERSPMEIKLILENQLAIMRWIIESNIGGSYGDLPRQIQKTAERVESWAALPPQ